MNPSPAPDRPFQFYDIVRRQNLTGQADQWGSLATCAQYRLAYQKTVQYLRENSLCLDWGCGNGHFSFFLVQCGFETHGFSFDKAPAFLASADRFHFIRGDRADPFSLPYSSGLFDAVFSTGVLEHVHEYGGDQARSMLEIARVLKPGGLFFVFHLPNRFSWIEFLVRRLNRWKGKKRHEHSKLYTDQDFQDLLKGTLFEILESGRYNFIPRNSFNRLPKAVTDQPWVCCLIDACDDFLARLFPGLCQNWFFILRKKRPPS
jgi:SAM-dependent methyltransferase